MILPYNAIEQLSVNDLSFESVKKKKGQNTHFNVEKHSIMVIKEPKMRLIPKEEVEITRLNADKCLDIFGLWDYHSKKKKKLGSSPDSYSNAPFDQISRGPK